MTAEPKVGAAEWAAMLAASGLLAAATALGFWAISWSEVFGFISAGVCVWLMVREHVATWPIGIASNVAYGILFMHSRLYADMSLQLVFAVLSVVGWINWGRRGGEQVAVTRTRRLEWWAVIAFLPLATLAIRRLLLVANGAAPFGDALTTSLSLAAQFLATRKRLENWTLWIVADLIYIPLYLSRGLPLTALLYGVFLLMCIAGWSQWRRTIAA
ncbi:MAG: nicotinamide riboside transporter PnuC [Nevskia sp.]